MGLTIKKMDEIHSAIYDGSIDFEILNIEEQSFALGVVISAGNRGVLSKDHFDEKQIAFLNKAKKVLAK
ncbi:MAG: hypothetical protein H6Q27_877 [Ignavibacteriaceae bacterium]|nr:hypothetical protein [Ignavibacteriaceae bacterium]